VSTSQLVSTIADALQSSNSPLTSSQASMVAIDIAQRSGALQVPGFDTDNSEGGASSAPIRGVNNASGGSTSTSAMHL
jgi:hypothetical protein